MPVRWVGSEAVGNSTGSILVCAERMINGPGEVTRLPTVGACDFDACRLAPSRKPVKVSRRPALPGCTLPHSSWAGPHSGRKSTVGPPFRRPNPPTRVGVGKLTQTDPVRPHFRTVPGSVAGKVCAGEISGVD